MSKRAAIIFLIIIGLVLYVLTLRGHIGNFDDFNNLGTIYSNGAFESPHERSTYAMMQALIHDHTVELSRPLASFGYDDVGFLEGRVYSYFPPGVAIAIIPFYLIGSTIGIGQLLAYMTPVLVALLALVFIVLDATEIFETSLWASLAAALIFGFGTTAWSYSITIYQHIFTTFFLVFGLYVFFKFKKDGHWSWAITGSCIYALSAFFDYVNLLILAPLIVSFFVTVVQRYRSTQKFKNIFLLIPVGVVIISFVLPLMYNQIVFGNWKIASNALPKFVATMSNQELSDPQMLNIDNRTVGRFNIGNFIHGLYILFLSPNCGLFVFSPILLLSILSLFFLKKFNHSENIFLLSSGICITIIYGLFDNPNGGWVFGPRYLIPLMAIMSLFIAQWLSRGKYVVHKKIATFILFLYSSGIALLGALTTNTVPFFVDYPNPYKYVGINFALHRLFTPETGNFLYSTYLAHSMSLWSYFLIIYFCVVAVFGYVLFVG